MKNKNQNTDFSAPLSFGEGSGVRIIHNASIITMDDALAKADAMVLNDLGKIEAIGTVTELRK
ncbi:MAG: hypothetical protein ACOVKP_07750, partial [Flavobacterium sp.]